MNKVTPKPVCAPFRRVLVPCTILLWVATVIQWETSVLNRCLSRNFYVFGAKIRFFFQINIVLFVYSVFF